MEYTIQKVSLDKLNEYNTIPMYIESNTIFKLKKPNGGLGGILLEEEQVLPFVKDLGKEEDPVSWLEEFQTKNWAIFIAYDNNKAIGGAVLVYQCKTIHMLKGRDDLCVLWDIRINPDYKKQGIGKALFKACEKWASTEGFKQLKIETQNNNTPGNKFYQKMGCTLGEINEYAYYGEYDDEVQLIWYKNLE